MPPQQYDTTQLDHLDHPVLGPLAFPSAMPAEERNGIIDNMMATRSKASGVSTVGGFAMPTEYANAIAPAIGVMKNIQQVSQVASQPKEAPPLIPSNASIQARTPTIGERLGSAIDPLIQHFKMGGAAQDPRLLAPEDVMTPLEKKNQPLATTIGETVGSLTTAPGILTMAATSGMGSLARVIGVGPATMLNRFVSGAFSLSMVKNAYDKYPAFKAAVDNGDINEAKHQFYGGVVDLGLAAWTGQHSLIGDPVPAQPSPNRSPVDMGRVTVLPPDPAGPGMEAARVGANTPKLPPSVGPQELPTPNSSTLMTGSTSGLRKLEPRQYDIAEKFGLIPRAASAGMSAYHEFQDPNTGGSFYVEKTATDEAISRKLADYRASINPADRSPELLKKGEDARKSMDAARVVVDNTKEPDMAGTPKPSDAEPVPEPIQKFVEKAPTMVQSMVSGQMEPIMTEIRLLEQRLAQMDRASAAKPVALGLSAAAPQTVAPPVRGSLTDWALPQHLETNINLLVGMRTSLDSTISEAQNTAISNRIEAVKADARNQLRQHLMAASDRQLEMLQADQKAKGADLDERAGAAASAIENNRKVEVANAELKAAQATGGPNTGGIDPDTGQPISERPESVINTESRSLINEIRGREVIAKPDMLIPHPKPKGMTDEAYAEHIANLNEKRMALRKHIKDQYEIVKDTGEGSEELMEKMHELDQLSGLIGKYPSGLKRPGQLTTHLGGRARIVDPSASGAGLTLIEARRIMGKQVNKIPGATEFAIQAKKLKEEARIRKMIADVIDKEKVRRADQKKGIDPAEQVAVAAETGVKPKNDPNQRGALGEVAIKQSPRPTLSIPSDAGMLDRAKQLGLDSYSIDEDNPRSGGRGWLSSDGKTWITAGADTHDTVAWKLLRQDMPEGFKHSQNYLEDSLGNSVHGAEAMKDGGWIRKTNDHDYEISRFTPDLIHTLANDGRYGRSMTIDYRDAQGQMKYIDIGKWEDVDDFAKQVRAGIRDNRGYNLQSGKIPGGVTGLAAGLGMAAGAVKGFAVGGPIGGIIGGSVGFVSGFLTPALMARMRPTLVKIAPLIRNISPRSWLFGQQQEAPATPAAEALLNAQRKGPLGAQQDLVARISLFTTEMMQHFIDPYTRINDQSSVLGKFVRQADPVGKVFNAQKVAVDDSLYVMARMTAGGPGGALEVRMMALRKAFAEAVKNGLLNHVDNYLNLTNYRRVYSVLREHANDLQMAIQNYQTKLQSPSITTKQTVALQDDIKEAQATLTDLQAKIKNGKVTPMGYTEGKIAIELAKLRQALSPDKMQHVQAIAMQIWKFNRDLLDLANQGPHRIVSDADYKTYVDRGIEYTPMQRIMQDMAGSDAAKNSWNAKNNPLYLRQQTIIRMLEGSERMNVSPITASATAAAHIVRQVQRNNVLMKAVDEAAKDPAGVGTLFKQVNSGYTPTPEENLVGGYRDDGIKVTYAVPRALADALNVASPVAAQTWLEHMARTSSALFRTGATLANIPFVMTSIPRHVITAGATSKVGFNWVNPKAGAIFLKDYFTAMGSTIVQGKWYLEALENGALDGVLQRNITPEQGLLDIKTGALAKLKRVVPMHGIEEFNRRADSISKVATYARMRQIGESARAAAWEARRFGGGPDFSLMGSSMGAWNLAFTFLNARVQYTGQTLSGATDKTRMKNFYSFLAAASLLALAAWEWNQSIKDPQGKPMWQHVLRNERERNWVILTPWMRPSSSGSMVPITIQIPKPAIYREIMNPLEDILYKVTKQDNRSNKLIGLNNISNWLPIETDMREDDVAGSLGRGLLSSMNPVARVPATLAANYDPAFGGRPIVPNKEREADPDLQTGLHTPEIYQRMGKGGIGGAIAGGAIGGAMGGFMAGIPGMIGGAATGAALGATGPSPRQVQYGVRGMTATAGDTIAKAADIPLGAKSTFPFQGLEKAQQIPVIGDIVSRFTGSGVDQAGLDASDKFYKIQGVVDQYKQSLAIIQQRTPTEVGKYINEHKEIGNIATMFPIYNARVQELNKAIQRVQTTMSDPNHQSPEEIKQGFDNLRTLNQTKIKMMRDCVEVVRAIQNKVGGAPSAVPSSSNPYGTSTGAGVKP